MTVYACLIVGPAVEAFLEPVAEGLAGAVDRLVVNVNAPQPQHAETLARTQLGREGRVVIVETGFEGFAAARNACLAECAEADWILNVDADEVHGPGLAVITRQLLPQARGDRVGGYLINFMQSFGRYAGISGKPTMLVRKTPGLRWVGDVHEKLEGVSGSVWKLPYALGHYSYCRSPQEVLEKWRQYRDLGDPSYVGEDLDKGPEFMDDQAWRTFRYRGQHPPALRRWLEREGVRDHVRRFESLARTGELRRSLRRFWDQQSIRFRLAQALAKLGPGREWRALAKELLERLGPWWAWD